jgi:hypothetical protein
MVKYTPASRGGIPGPQQASDQAITQIDRETQRIVRALREERDAAIANRDRISKSMVQNQKIESEQSATNNQIALQNQQTLFEKQAAVRKQALDEYNASTAVSREMFGAISKFSDIAASKLQEMEKDRYLKTWSEDLARLMINGENDPLAKEARENELEQKENVVIAEGGVIKAGKQGANPLDTSSAAVQLSELNPAVQTYRMMKAARGWGIHLATLEKDFTAPDGSTFKAQEAVNDPAKMQQVINSELEPFLEKLGLKGINPGVLWNAGLLPSIMRQNQVMINQATKQQIADNKAQVETQALSLVATKGIENLTVSLQEARRMMQMAGFSNSAINEKLDAFAIKQAALKNPYFDANQYINSLRGPNGEPIGEARKIQLQVDFLNAKNSARSAASADEKFRSDEFLREALPQVQDRIDAAATDEQKIGIVNELILKYKKKFDGRAIDSRIISLEKETLGKIKEREESVLANMIAADSVSSMSQADNFQTPSVRKKFIQALTSSKTSKFGPNYTDVEKSLKSKAEKLIGYTPSVAGRTSPEAVVMEQVLIKDLRQRMSVLTAPGGKYANNPAAAVSEAIAQQEAEIVKGKTDSNSLFYKDANGKYVNIERGITRQTDTINGRIYNMRKEISLGNDPFKVPELVLPTTELTTKVRLLEQGAGGFDVGPEIRALARDKGMSNFDAFIRLVEGRGIKHNIPKALGLGMNNIQYRDPATARMLDNIEVRSPMIIKRGAAVSGGTVNNFARGAFKGLSQTIGGVESFGGNYGAYNRGGYAGGHGAIAPGISNALPEMTISEIQRRQTEPGLDPSEHLWAVGKYQITGPTLKALMQGKYGDTGITPDMKFTPEVQEKLFEFLARNRIVPGNTEATMAGLRQEWIGLQNVSDAELREAIEPLM